MSLGRKYLFANVMFLVYFDGLEYVYVCESYIVLDQCDESPSLFVLSVCAYGGVVGYFGFLCEFCFLYCDDVRLGVVY